MDQETVKYMNEINEAYASIKEVFGRKRNKKGDAKKNKPPRVKSTDMGAYYPVMITTYSSEQKKSVADALSDLDDMMGMETQGSTIVIYLKAKSPESARYVVEEKLKENGIT